MPLSPNADMLEAGHNVAFDLARLYTYPNYWHLATPEVLGEVQQFYLRNRKGDKIHLDIRETYIYCDACLQK